MKRTAWNKRITECCRAVGTYREAFVPVIETLSVMLERRDAAQTAFDKSGDSLTVEHKNARGGGVNIELNPTIKLINDLNRDALAYWRELGLTPAGLKKIDEAAMKQKKKSALAEALKEIGCG